MNARRARAAWLALCAASVLVFAALTWQAVQRGPVWHAVAFAAVALASIGAIPAGAAMGFLARRGGHRARTGPTGHGSSRPNLAARAEYVIPPSVPARGTWQPLPWPPGPPPHIPVNNDRRKEETS